MHSFKVPEYKYEIVDDLKLYFNPNVSIFKFLFSVNIDICWFLKLLNIVGLFIFTKHPKSVNNLIFKSLKLFKLNIFPIVWSSLCPVAPIILIFNTY